MDIFSLLSLSFRILLGASLSGLCLGSIWFCGRAIYSAINYLTHFDPTIAPGFHPHVTVLQSLAALTSATYANLLSFCQQEYPHYRIIFVAPTADHPSINVAQRLMQQFPERDLQIVVGVVNQLPDLEPVKSPLLVIADSNTRVDNSYLQRIVQPFRYPAVGVVTCPYRISGTGWLVRFQALGAATELHLALMARCFKGVHFTFPTIAIRKSLFTQLQTQIPSADAVQSQLTAFRQADGMQLGPLPGLLGYRTVLSHYVVSRDVVSRYVASRYVASRDAVGRDAANRDVVNRDAANRDVVNHLISPAENRYLQNSWQAGLHYGVVFSLLLLVLTGGSAYGWIIGICTWIARFAMAGTIGGCLQDRSIQHYGWLLPVYDCISFGLWLSRQLGHAIKPAQPNSTTSSTPLANELAADHVIPILQARAPDGITL